MTMTSAMEGINKIKRGTYLTNQLRIRECSFEIEVKISKSHRFERLRISPEYC